MVATVEQFVRHYAPELFMTRMQSLRYRGFLDEENKWTFSKPFPHAFRLSGYGQGAPPRTLMELNMMRLSATIRSEPGWPQKTNDPAAVAKWKEEAGKLGLTEAQFKFVIAELDFYASLKSGSIGPSVVDGVWLADGQFCEEVGTSLIREVANLENIPEQQKDWKPGSSKQVLNLVDPSLFCLVYGVTRRVEETGVSSMDLIGGGDVIPPPVIPRLHHGKKPYMNSEKYQWLPAEFHVRDTGEVETKSYINNLHPKWHANIYKILADIFKGIVPLLSKTLASIVDSHPLRIDVDPLNWYTDPPDRPEYDSDGREIYYDEFEGCELIFPDAPIFETLEKPSYESVNFLGRNLQVVVELKNIVLTPDNPVYPEEAWHIQGMLNEQILMSAIYYYQVENISESKMHFRQKVWEPESQEFDYDRVRRIYSLVDGDPLNQNLGSVVIRDNRCIAFPNFYQYRVDPLQLEDKTRPGRCKMLLFFVVDPAVRVLSTMNVPPQQKSWYVYQLQEMEPFNRLPLEILEKIVGYLQWPMSLEEAKIYREKLEEERKEFTVANNKNFFERRYSPR